MNITAHDYGKFIEIVKDPDGSGQYATTDEYEVPTDSTLAEFFGSLGYEMMDDFSGSNSSVPLIEI